MELNGRTILILGGAGLVGRAVARQMLEHRPARLILGSLRQNEAEEAVAEVRSLDASNEVDVEGVWGDLFAPEDAQGLAREALLSDSDRRARMLDDLYGPLTPEVLGRSALGALLLRTRPDVIVDCINTAGALAYRNAFQSATALRTSARAGGASVEDVERHLATMYLPQLIRHAQIALQGMKEAGTRIYVKIGTAGTGGMGLNIPFTHSEERPSRVLLAKAGLAGAHTLLLYLMARTPGAPAVKEIKPTAAISWKSIGYGEIRQGGRAFQRVDCTEALPIDEAFGDDVAQTWTALEEPLTGVYLDAGENGLFSLGEFEVLTALGLMEFVTPEEIADNVLKEIQSHPTGKDVVSALDASTMGPTYRAGILRGGAIERMEQLESQHGEQAVAYEMLGPPRVAKLLFEATILDKAHHHLETAGALDPQEMADFAGRCIHEDADLRQRILSTGLAILLTDGESVLRGTTVKLGPEPGEALTDAVIDRGLVDLRPANWARWKGRVQQILSERSARPTLDEGSVADHDPFAETEHIRPAPLVSWILRTEERGERIKR